MPQTATCLVDLKPPGRPLPPKPPTHSHTHISSDGCPRNSDDWPTCSPSAEECYPISEPHRNQSCSARRLSELAFSIIFRGRAAPAYLSHYVPPQISTAPKLDATLVMMEDRPPHHCRRARGLPPPPKLLAHRVRSIPAAWVGRPALFGVGGGRWRGYSQMPAPDGHSGTAGATGPVGCGVCNSSVVSIYLLLR